MQLEIWPMIASEAFHSAFPLTGLSPGKAAPSTSGNISIARRACLEDFTRNHSFQASFQGSLPNAEAALEILTCGDMRAGHKRAAGCRFHCLRGQVNRRRPLRTCFART